MRHAADRKSAHPPDCQCDPCFAELKAGPTPPCTPVGQYESGVTAEDAAVTAAVLEFAKRPSTQEPESINAHLDMHALALLRHALARVHLAILDGRQMDAEKAIEEAWTHTAMLRIPEES